MFGLMKKGSGVQGLTHGIINGVLTSMGVVIGLSATGNKFLLLFGILAVGIADALGDSLAFHVAQETEIHHSKREVRVSTALTFFGILAGFIIMGIPVLLFDIGTAIIISGTIGIVMLAGLGYFVAMINPKLKKGHQMVEYVVMGIIVIIVTYYVSRIAIGLGV